LLAHFGSGAAVKRAGAADLEKVEGISRSMAKRIYDYFHTDG
jgi:excinuclease ABC subunit C